jgi:hypothetical protein
VIEILLGLIVVALFAIAFILHRIGLSIPETITILERWRREDKEHK